MANSLPDICNELYVYCDMVVRKKIVACQKYIWACQRFINDVDRIKEDDWPWMFDNKAAHLYIDNWVSLFKHSCGVLAGQPKVFTPYERFVYGNIYGWKDKQTGIRRFRRSYEQVARKNAKALALDTPIPTPNGWTTMKYITNGCKIFGDDGQPCTVIGTSKVFTKNDCYIVKFSDGSKIVADAGHLWQTEIRRGKKKNNIHTTEQIANSLNVNSPCNLKNNRIERNHKIHLPSLLHLPEKQLIINPYVLGAWLGDGNSYDAGMTTGIIDFQILKNISDKGYKVKTKLSSTNNNSNYSYISIQNSSRKHSFVNNLKFLNVLNNKHIPIEYLRASFLQRLELLQGLMDTDGTISKTGQCVFCNSSKKLIDNVFELLCTLGYKPTITESNAKIYNKEYGIAYRVQFWAYDNLKVFTLRRKYIRQKKQPKRKTRSAYRQIISVIKCKSVPTKCIIVDSPNHMFLAGKSMIPTHNSQDKAIQALYELSAFGESKAEVYIAATKKEQTRHVWGEARWLYENGHPDLADKFSCKNDIDLKEVVIKHKASGSFFARLSKEDRKSGDGSNPHFFILDEYHLQDTTEYLDLAVSGMKTRKQPLLSIITTAGLDINVPCYRIEYDYVSKLLNPESSVTNDRYFAVVCEIDKNETPDVIVKGKRRIEPGQTIDEIGSLKAIQKSNPILCNDANSIQLIREEVQESLDKPEHYAKVLTKTFNMWVNQRAAGYMNMTKWKLCANTDSKLRNMVYNDKQTPFIGIDLSLTTDLTSIAFVFNLPNGYYYVIHHSFIPQDNITTATERDNVPYQLWVDNGHITAIPGSNIEYNFVLDWIIDQFTLHSNWKKGIACFDRSYAAWLQTEFDKLNFLPISIPQSYTGLSLPTKNLRAKVYDRKILHENDPVLNWAMSNCVIRMGPSENIMLDKSAARFRIDPVAALINAMNRAIATDNPQKKTGRVIFA